MPVVTCGIRIYQREGELSGGEVVVPFDPAEREVDFPGNEVAGFVYDECRAVIDVSWPLSILLFKVPVRGAGLGLDGEGDVSYGFCDAGFRTAAAVDLFIDADNPANSGLWAAFGVRGPGDRRRLVWCGGDDELDVVQALFDTTGLCCSCRVGECPGYRVLAGHVEPGELSSRVSGSGKSGGDGRRLTLAHGDVVFAYLLRLGAAADAVAAEAG